jgi:hypothetical protein
MTRLTCFAAAALVCLTASNLTAQTWVAVQPVTTYYAPSTQAVASPVVSTPVTAYYAPSTHVVASPVVSTVTPTAHVVASPVVATAPVATTCCSQVVAAPVVSAPTVTYYRAPQVAWQSTPQVVTRHRPILGGTVTRVHNVWAPVVY